MATSLLVAEPAHAERPAKPQRDVSPAPFSADERLRFDIPAQALASALEAFGKATGLSGFYSAESMAGKTSKPLTGRYTPDAALRLLLDGQSLGLEYTAVDAFVLEPLPNAAFQPPVLRDRRVDGALQGGVRDAFCREPLLAAGAWRIAVSFTLDTQGHVQNPVLLNTTGDGRRDQAIVSALARVDTGLTPADVSSPYVMLIVPPAAGQPPHCGAP